MSTSRKAFWRSCKKIMQQTRYKSWSRPNSWNLWQWHNCYNAANGSSGEAGHWPGLAYEIIVTYSTMPQQLAQLDKHS